MKRKHSDSELLDAVDAFDAERARWSVRFNKSLLPGQFEIFRSNDDGEPVVMASIIGEETADYECQEMASIAAMKSAITKLWLCT